MPAADAPDAIELETTELLARLESARQRRSGRLADQAESFERAATAERDAGAASRSTLEARARRRRGPPRAASSRGRPGRARPRRRERLRQALKPCEQQQQADLGAS